MVKSFIWYFAKPLEKKIISNIFSEFFAITEIERLIMIAGILLMN